MAVSRKHGAVKVENGLIADDEPVFIICAHSPLAKRVIEYYLILSQDSGYPGGHNQLVREELEDVLVWQERNGTQAPEGENM